MPLDINFVDKTGQPRSEEDLKEALDALEIVMVRNILKVPPEFAVYLPTIRAAIKELLNIRQLIKNIKEKKRVKENQNEK